jgi:hypothetical protein
VRAFSHRRSFRTEKICSLLLLGTHFYVVQIGVAFVEDKKLQNLSSTSFRHAFSCIADRYWLPLGQKGFTVFLKFNFLPLINL